MDWTLHDHLHLGCGLKTPPRWLNVDGSWQVALARRPWMKRVLSGARVLPRSSAEVPWSAEVMRLDLTRPLPFPGSQFDAVYSSHLLEHLHNEQALALLRECRRVMKTGAVCRAVVPDLRSLVGRYLARKAAGDADSAGRFMEEMLVHERGAHRGLRGAYCRWTAFHQHKWMYDAESLRQLFESAGFANVRTAGYLDSAIVRIGEVEEAGRIEGGEGVAVEGTK